MINYQQPTTHEDCHDWVSCFRSLDTRRSELPMRTRNSTLYNSLWACTSRLKIGRFHRAMALTAPSRATCSSRSRGSTSARVSKTTPASAYPLMNLMNLPSSLMNLMNVDGPINRAARPTKHRTYARRHQLAKPIGS